MLGESDVMTNIAVKDFEEAKKFYGQTLGLKVIKDEDYGVMYRSGPSGGRVFVYPAPTAGTAKSTTATWEVKDLKKVITELEAAGVQFEHYDAPGAKHDGHIHIWEGMQAAWFRDPSGNILGLSQNR